MNPRVCDCDRCGLVVRAEDAEATVRENEELLKWYRGGLLTIESTEAENARLRAELAEQRRSERFLREHSAMVEANEALRAELAAAQAAWLVEVNKVARVRELCDEPHPMGRVYVYVTDVLAAIEGSQP